MNLEAIEQQALNYLAQVSNPLVRIEVLYAHLRDHGLAEGLDMAGLKDFLAKHDLIRVMEPALPVEDLEGIGAAEAPGVPSGAYAILATRVPSDQQLAAMMVEQLDAMREALQAAKTEALDRADVARMSALDAALNRVHALRAKLAPHGEGPDETGDGNEDRPPNILDFPG